MVNQHVLPAVLHYKKELGDVIKMQKEIGFESTVEKSIYKKVNYAAETLYTRMENLVNGVNELDDDGVKASHTIAQTLMPLSTEIAELCNELEELVPDTLWTLPKYYDMLFLR